MSQVTTGVQLGEAEAVRASVSKYYGEVTMVDPPLPIRSCPGSPELQQQQQWPAATSCVQQLLYQITLVAPLFQFNKQ